MRRLRAILLVAGVAWMIATRSLTAAEPPLTDVMSDTWAATDALGRIMPTHEDVGAPRKGRYVGIFYFLWLGQHGKGLFNITEILAANPQDPPWGPSGAFHFWDKPLFGYYLSDDAWVIRRHGQMLSDVGVDVVVFDVTNAATYDSVYPEVCRVYRQMRSEGQKTPQIAFLTNSSSATVVHRLYDRFYLKNQYSELWFRWNGKPLMMASPQGLRPEVRDFFTLRQSWAWTHPGGWFGDGKDKWPWLDHHPQKPGWHESPDRPEQIAVAVAQHPTTNIGRSFHAGKQPPPGQAPSERGLCFAEQWQRALEVDPPFVFVTGWNEWVAQRFLSDGRMRFLGKPLPKGGTFFVDAYSQEFSRDIEPMAGGHGDNYYMQLAANIRRYKGARSLPPASEPKAIRIDGKFEEWADVKPEYLDVAGDTAHRDHLGWGGERYVNETGRNDFSWLRVARDSESICFYAETAKPVTERRGQNWMLLFIDIDGRRETGWEGYDFLVNRSVAAGQTVSVERYDAGRWVMAGSADFRLRGKQLELAVPRRLLGLRAGPVQLDFHWADNIRDVGDATEFYLHGDSAPNGRFNYRYRALP